MTSTNLCFRGHPLVPAVLTPSGKCRACARIREARRVRNRVSHRALVKRWKIAHPERNRKHQRDSARARFARERGGGGWAPAQWRTLLAEYGNICVCCHTPESLLRTGLILVPDHIRPLAKGGTNTLDNLQPLCHGKGGCNIRKGVQWIDYRAGFPIYFV